MDVPLGLERFSEHRELIKNVLGFGTGCGALDIASL